MNYLLSVAQKSFSLLMLVIFILGSCTKENTIEEPPAAFDISIDLDDLDVRWTCENDGSSGRADLYHTLIIQKSTDSSPFDLSEIYRSDEVLIQIGLNERIETTSLASSFSFTPADEDRLTFIIQIEERDPGTVQVHSALRYEIQYNAAADCWSELNKDTCLFNNSNSVKKIESKFGNGSMPGSRCLVNYQWSIYLKQK